MATKTPRIQSPEVDAYIERSKRWPKECAALRHILLDCGLAEAIKWGKPCYAHDGKNLAIIQEFKSFVALLFFKGALIDDAFGFLESQGANTRSALRVCFSNLDDVKQREESVREYVRQAALVEASGRVLPPASKLVFINELKTKLSTDPALKAAFLALTPGRQREYHLYFSGAKKTETRAARIEKCAPKIRRGKGLRD